MITARHRSYPFTKEPIVDWTGVLPLHWEVKRLKDVAELNPESLREDTATELEMTYVDIGGVDGLGRIVDSEVVTFANAPTRARRVVRSGDIIVSTVRTYLRAIATIRDPAPNMIVSTGFAVVRPRKELSTDFAAYALRAPYFVERVVASSRGVSFPAISDREMATYELAIPPLAEQRIIAAFLDRETARIDALVAKKERLIDLLQEKQSAIVTRAVTKGLNPNVPMKESGVEWLGEIPSHWEVKRIRDVATSLQTGPFGSQLHASDYVIGGYPVINPANLRGGSLVEDPECAVDAQTAQRLAHHRLEAGDILFARRGELGRCGLVAQGQEGWLCGTGCLRLRVSDAIASSDFIMRLLSTPWVAKWLELQSVGATMQNINTSIIGRIPVALPPVVEQERIDAFLSGELAKIACILTRIRTAIDHLHELRTALISAAVTGKIDVREEAA